MKPNSMRYIPMSSMLSDHKNCLSERHYGQEKSMPLPFYADQNRNILNHNGKTIVFNSRTHRIRRATCSMGLRKGFHESRFFFIFSDKN